MHKSKAALFAVLALLVSGAQAAVGQASIGGAEREALCQAAVSDGELELVVDALVETSKLSYQQAPELLRVQCGDQSLLQQLVNQRQAENFEFVVIDLGIDVHSPMVAAEAGQLSLMQYLMQQSIQAPSAEARQFALEYLQDLRNVDFNPNLQLLVMH